MIGHPFPMARTEDWYKDVDVLTMLTVANNRNEWKQAILRALETQPGKCASLLFLMSAARLQSRNIRHPFNDALKDLVDEKRVTWQDVAGQPIRICIAE